MYTIRSAKIAAIWLMLFLAHTPLFAIPMDGWEKTFGGTGRDWGYSVQQTSDGGYIVTGEVRGWFGSVYKTGVYLVKTDPVGNMQWSKAVDGGSSCLACVGHSVQETSDGGYIVTGYWIDNYYGYIYLYLLKTDSAGNLVWDKRNYGQGRGYCVQQTDDGGFIVAGISGSSGYDENVWLIKTFANGNLHWQRTFGEYGEWDRGYFVQQTSDGGYIVAGETSSSNPQQAYLVKTDSIGTLQWSHTFQESRYARCVRQTSDLGYILTGQGVGIWPDLEVSLIKTDAGGALEWCSTYGGSGIDCGYSVRQTDDKGYLVAGTCDRYNTCDVYLLKTDAAGNLQFEETFGGAGEEWGESVQLTKDNGYIIAGSTWSYGAGDYDVYLIHGFLPSLTCYPSEISENGGEVDLFLGAGAENSCRHYLLLGSATGTVPGTPLPGALAVLPLNWDLFTNLVVSLVNTPIFRDFLGILDEEGKAMATFDTLGPLPPGSAGLVLHFAYALNKPWNFASNPVAIEIVP